MLRRVKTICTVCTFILLVMTGAGQAAESSELAGAAFQAKERGQFLAAIGLFNEAMANRQLTQKQRGLLLFGRGTSYQQLGMKESALADLDGTVALLPDFAGGYLYRALIWTAERRYEEAVADLQQAHQLAPSDASIVMNLGSVYAQTNRLDLAVENYDLAIRLRPDLDRAYYDRALAYLIKHDAERAMSDFDRAIQLRPNFAAAIANRGALHLAIGNFGKAMADLNTAIELAPRDAKLKDARANANLANGHYDDALADLDEALKIDPGNPALYFGRGRTKLFLENTSAAIDDLKVAVRLRPTDANAVIWLHIARLHANTADDNEFAANAARVKRGPWPGAVLDLYLGASTPTETLAKAQEGPPEESDKRVCEAQFYAADYGLHRGASDEAIDLMRGVIARCRAFTVVYGAAQAEVRLAAQH